MSGVDGLLTRHSPRVTAVDPRSPLQIGNGQFAMAVDVTGLQTFPGAYPGPGGGTLLQTMSHWGWHSMPYGRDFRIESCVRDYDTPRGPVPYVDLGRQLWGAASDGTGAGGLIVGEGTAEEVYFRANPQRIDLGRIGLDLPEATRAGDLSGIEQHLDLRTGRLRSAFTAGTSAYTVDTVVDMASDSLVVSVRANAGAAGLRLDFPYASEHPGNAQDWDRPGAHTTRLLPGGAASQPGWRTWRIDRVLDDVAYAVAIRTNGLVAQTGPHRIVIAPGGKHPSSVGAIIQFVPVTGAEWAKPALVPSSPDEVLTRTAAAWQRYWAGGSVKLHRSDHPQALELERRIVLSRYLTRINSAGLLPVPETGLYVNSWRGKFHLEMQWWHLAHFALWGQADIVEQVLGWYAATLDSGRQIASSQGYPGVRWLKSSGPEARPTPSSIASFLIWQQPHPVYLAELVRRADPRRDTVERWWPVVRATAQFMAVYPIEGDRGLVFPPPLIPSQECYAPMKERITDPTYELVYWAWGLRTAAQWAASVGEADLGDHWRGVAERMDVPRPRHGVYPSLGMAPWTTRVDHPSVVASLGVTPGTGTIDPSVMAATLADIRREWDWDSTWGWDYPMMAMTATRVGQPDWAVEALLKQCQKNTYLANGHNWQTPDLPAYLPGNGGLLTAVALMVAGWDGGPARPGFGAGWQVDAEGIAPLP